MWNIKANVWPVRQEHGHSVKEIVPVTVTVLGSRASNEFVGQMVSNIMIFFVLRH